MRALARTRPVLAVLVGVLVLLGFAGMALAANTRPDFSLGISPMSQSVPQGSTASYTVSTTGTGGFTGSVTYTVSGLPAGVAGTFSPSSTALSSSSSTGSTVLGVATTTNTAAGTYNLTITGTSGSTKRTVSANLTITYAFNAAFTISAAPSSVTVAPGSTAVYTVTVTRTSPFTGAVTMAPYGSWPSGVSPIFSPNPVTGSSSTLQVSTTAAAATGTYTLYLVGSYTDSGKTTYQYAQVQLTVQASGKAFTISGGSPANPLAPGVSNQPLNLALSNPNKQAISVTNLSVTVTGTNNSGCDATNFQMTQYSGPYPISVPASANGATLSSLGITPTQMPQLKMRDLTTNQDACKGVAVSLSYSGSATGN